MSEPDADVCLFDKNTGRMRPVLRGVLSWPSLRWQMYGLTASIVTGDILVFSILWYPGWHVLFGLALVASAFYGGFGTNWFAKLEGASLPKRTALAFATVCGLAILGAILVILLGAFFLISLPFLLLYLVSSMFQ